MIQLSLDEKERKENCPERNYCSSWQRDSWVPWFCLGSSINNQRMPQKVQAMRAPILTSQALYAPMAYLLFFCIDYSYVNLLCHIPLLQKIILRIIIDMIYFNQCWIFFNIACRIFLSYTCHQIASYAD